MPPARSTRISDRQWDDVQTRIKQLVHQHVPLSCKDGSRVTIPEILQRENNLDITVSQLEAKLKEWNVAKNLRLREWQVIMPWLDELEDNGTEYQVLLAGKEIKKTAIRRARRRLKQKSHDDALLGCEYHLSELFRASVPKQPLSVRYLLPSQQSLWDPTQYLYSWRQPHLPTYLTYMLTF